MLVQLIRSDNDSGRAAARMGQGPGQILAGGAVELLRRAGHRVEVVQVEVRDPFPLEIASAFSTAAAIATQVRMASRQRRFPLVLAGNCMASLGAISGLRPGRRGVVWLDAHADLHRPETTSSGFLDGMALATVLGQGWAALTAGIPGFNPLDPDDVLLLGVRDADPPEFELAGEQGVYLAGVDEMRQREGAVTERLAELGGRVEQLHLHLDLDVLDPDRVGPANGFAPPGGLDVDELLAWIRAVKSSARVASATLSAYDPSHDRAGAVRDAAITALQAIVA